MITRTAFIADTLSQRALAKTEQQRDGKAGGKYNAVISGSIVFLFDREIGTNSNNNEDMPCQHGDVKLADDGINQCVCNLVDWVCTNVEYEDGSSGDDDSLFGIPSISLLTSFILVGLIAIFRRKN